MNAITVLGSGFVDCAVISPCSICRVRKPVPGNGPLSARIMVIGEGPGREEHSRGIPFCGMTGQELDGLYLPLAGLDRREVYATNTIKCWEKKPDPDRALRCAAEHLACEIQDIRPEWIFLLGSVANHLIAGSELYMDHGLPRWANLYGHTCKVVPMYHPALAFHTVAENSDGSNIPVMETLRRDFYRVLEREMINIREEPIEPVEYGVDGSGTMEGDVIFLDTETVPGGKPWVITLAGNTGRGWYAWPDFIRNWDPEFIGTKLLVSHNEEFDLRVLLDLGIPIPTRHFDTMKLANLLHLPQSLKVLAYRLLGIRMRSYRDVVFPYVRQGFWAFLMQAASHSYPKGVVKGPGISARINRLARDLFRDVDGGTTIKRWRDTWPQSAKDAICGRVGREPQLSLDIRMVPEREALSYAVEDAVRLSQVYGELCRIGGLPVCL